jgi:hypothetical protein
MYLFGKTRTVPMMHGSGMGRYYQLGYYRPNQAYDRSIIRGRTTLRRSADLRGLGMADATSTANDILNAAAPATTDYTTPLLILGGVAAVGLLFLRKGSGASDKKKIARLAAQRALASRQLKELT